MTEISINYLAILIAALASMGLGSLWFGPLFGKTWIRLIGMSQERMAASQQAGMTKLFLIQFLVSLIQGWILANAIIFVSAYLKIDTLSAGLLSGLFSWLGFVAPVTIGSVLWEDRPWQLWWLNSSYYLILLLLMGAILGVWR